MKITVTRIFSLLLFCLLMLECKKKKNNEEYKIDPGSLTQSPLDTGVVAGLVPLGNLNPPGHTFPTDHMYFYFKTPLVAHSLYAPGQLHVFQVSRFRFNPGTPGETQDYRVEFGSSGGTVLYFAHISSLSTVLNAAAGGFSGSSCEIYSTGGTNIEYCRKEVSLEMNAGDLIGTANIVPGQFAIDMGFLVNNVAVCPLDYFDAPTRTKLEAKIGNYNGTIKRSTPPLCGEYKQDLSGTLQGNWLKQGLPKYPEDNHIAFVKDNVEPAKPRISIGSAVPGLASGVYTFTASGSGNIDRGFTDVTNNGQIYCYTPKYLYGAVVPNTSILVKLENNTTLSFEKRNCDCSCNTPYAFTASKMTYVRE